jgi:hypothetical protein
MQNTILRSLFGIRCRDRRARARRLVLALFASALWFVSSSAFAMSRNNDTIEHSTRNLAPGSVDLSDQIGPLTLANSTFWVSGTDTHGAQHDLALSGHDLGVDKLVFDQVSLAMRIGVVGHFSIGIPLSFGGAPVNEHPLPAAVAGNSVRTDGDAAMLLGIGVSPGYEINFGDSAFRFDAAILGRVILLPTNLSTLDKHGNPVPAEGQAAQLAFEPRLTILPYARGDLGLGFYGEIDAVHPDNWSCGAVIQMRFGRRG